MVERWKSKVIHLNAHTWTGTGLPSNTNEHFDDLGAQGWELVGTEAVQRASLLMLGSNTVGVIAYFKRRLHT